MEGWSVVSVSLLVAVLLALSFFDNLVVIQAGAIPYNVVSLTFYDVSLDSWNSMSSTRTLKEEIVQLGNTYCRQTPLSCGLVETSAPLQLSVSNIVIVDGFPFNGKRNLLLSFYITYPVGANVSVTSQAQIGLHKTAVREITARSVARLSSKVGAYLIYIDDEHFSPPPATTENEIIIPIACILVPAALVLTLALRHCRNQDEKEAMDHVRGRMKKCGRITPSQDLEASARIMGYTRHKIPKQQNADQTPYPTIKSDVTAPAEAPAVCGDDLYNPRIDTGEIDAPDNYTISVVPAATYNLHSLPPLNQEELDTNGIDSRDGSKRNRKPKHKKKQRRESPEENENSAVTSTFVTSSVEPGTPDV